MLITFENMPVFSILQVRCPALNFYVLKEHDQLYLLDAGFIGAEYFLNRELKAVGWQHLPIKGIIVTHGHLDHILNVAHFARKYQDWIAAPEIDLPHYQGKPIYSGWSHVTGILEKIGRPTLGFKSFTPDRLLNDGDQLEIWGGLQTIHLPGHTMGHSGFYATQLQLLFSADLFASYGRFAHYPPAIFNSDPSLINDSVKKALSLDLTGLLPNHGDRSNAAVHLLKLKQLRIK